nr:hypothetical protein [uncultured Roseococcus sp.]
MPAMTTMTTLGYATLADGVYYDTVSQLGSFARQTLRPNEISGFHAALYMRAVGGQLEYVVSFAGSETDQGMVDWRADLGFGGSKGQIALAALGGLAGIGLAAHAERLLAQQRASAIAFTIQAMQAAKNSRLTLTGHSLGGGLAQMAAAATGVAAVTFSAPAVSAVKGVEASFGRSRPKIVNFRVKNDPVNISEQAGKRLGVVVTMMSPRGIDAAHQIPNTLEELRPQGQFSTTGARDPFSFQGDMSISS